MVTTTDYFLKSTSARFLALHALPEPCHPPPTAAKKEKNKAFGQELQEKPTLVRVARENLSEKVTEL